MVNDSASPFLSLTHLIIERAKDHHDTTAIHTSASKADSIHGEVGGLTYGQINRAVDRLAWFFADKLGLSPEGVKQSQDSPVVAMLVSSSVHAPLLELALAKMGACGLILSPNNSGPAIAHLCKITGSVALIYGADYESRSVEAARILEEDNLKLPLFREQRCELWGKFGVEEAGSVTEFIPWLDPQVERSRTAVITHSSGSTGFPKPIRLQHAGFLSSLAINAIYRETTFNTAPLYHAFGHAALFGAIHWLKPFTLFPSHLPLTITNITRVLDEVNTIPTSKPKQMFGVPYTIKLLSESDKGLTALASFDLVASGGAPFPDNLGEVLVRDRGVKLLSMFGTSEVGIVLTSIRDFEDDKDWNYLRPVPLALPFIQFDDYGNNTCELVVKDGFPAKVGSNRPDGSWATNDMFERHPQRPNLYKYIGRLDDTIVQSLGEKTNPVPMELCIRSNVHVSEAIVFGVGRPNLGVLILPSSLAVEQDLLPADGIESPLIPLDLSERFIDNIWPTIEKANAQAPTHSRIMKEMIGVLRYGTEIPLTPKLSIKRTLCYTEFDCAIDSIYQSFASTPIDDITQIKIPVPPEPPTQLENHLLSLVQSSLPGRQKIAKMDDFFELGIDSLQGAKIRNHLQLLVGTASTMQLGQNVVYEHPTVLKLARHIVNVVHPDNRRAEEEDEESLMSLWVEELQSKLVRPISPKERNGGHIVLLTGATGSLGAHILFNLVKSDRVEKIICLSRASSHTDCSGRVSGSLKSRRLVITGKEWCKVTCLAGDINAKDGRCGLSSDEWDRLDISIVIHNAWPVNFSYSLSSYYPHIYGASNLLNIARAKGASFFFSSSVSTRLHLHSTCLEGFPGDNETFSASEGGYGRSKWVVEKLCEKAGGSIGVLRIGQLVGDTKHGIWNTSESWPLMIKCANTLRAIPLTHESVSFLPVDTAAAAITQLVLNPILVPTVYHVVNPRLTSWDNVIISGLRDCGLKFNTVSIKEWLGLLQASDGTMEDNPTRKLLLHYERKYQNPSREPLFSVQNTCKLSPALQEATPISVDLVRRWVEHWRDIKFLY